jgi:hypothetical protein
MMKRKWVIGGVVCTAALAITSGFTNSSFASMISHPSSGHNDTADVKNIPKSPIPVSQTVTHHSLTDRDLQIFKWLAIEVTPLNPNSPEAQGIISEQQALFNTDILMQQFGGASRNIQLVNVSRFLDEAHTKPTTYTDNQTNRDPHFKNGQFKDIPCYLITINGVDIASPGGNVHSREFPPGTYPGQTSSLCGD